MNILARVIRRFGIALVLTLGLPVAGFAQRHIVPDPVDPPMVEPPSAKALLGEALFFDTLLSTPKGTSCASCHDPGTGWSDARSALDPLHTPTSESAIRGRYGPRNSLTTPYADLGPAFFYDAASGSYVGGRYWDGRSPNTLTQATVPFTSDVEMNNPSALHVIHKVRKSGAAPLFEQTFGHDIWNDPDQSMNAIAECLAEYQKLVTRQAFTSRFDRFLKGDATALAPQEKAGRALFEGRAGCTACHTSALRPDGMPPLFTTYRFYNLGVPRNPNNPFYGMPASVNPDGAAYRDKGLGGALGLASEEGKFKVPTLRNVALTSPYMHNGVFTTLEEAVQFHNTRDVGGRWDPPETPANIVMGPGLTGAPISFDGAKRQPPGGGDGGGLPVRLGNLGLTPQEVEQIVAFLRTLSDESVAGP